MLLHARCFLDLQGRQSSVCASTGRSTTHGFRGDGGPDATLFDVERRGRRSGHPGGGRHLRSGGSGFRSGGKSLRLPRRRRAERLDFVVDLRELAVQIAKQIPAAAKWLFDGLVEAFLGEISASAGGWLLDPMVISSNLSMFKVTYFLEQSIDVIFGRRFPERTTASLSQPIVDAVPHLGKTGIVENMIGDRWQCVAVGTLRWLIYSDFPCIFSTQKLR